VVGLEQGRKRIADSARRQRSRNCSKEGIRILVPWRGPRYWEWRFEVLSSADIAFGQQAGTWFLLRAVLAIRRGIWVCRTDWLDFCVSPASTGSCRRDMLGTAES
jgi:hypothetical protein